jgi:ATP-binding cassette subfamily B protein
MIASYHGKEYGLDYFQNLVYANRLGVNFNSLKAVAQEIGLNSKAVKLSVHDLVTSVPLPCILHWNQNHFVVLPPQHLSLGTDVLIADPAKGLVKIEYAKFIASWLQSTANIGYVLIFNPTAQFYEHKNVPDSKKGLKSLLQYARNERFRIAIIIFCLFLEASIALSFPFLTKNLYDKGVFPKSVSVINMVIISQTVIFIISLLARILRGWQLLFINSKIIRNLLSDYLSHLLKLPIKYFDSKKVGDITQRIADHNKIESFLTSGYFTTFLSVFSLVIYAIILGYFHLIILFVFLIGSMIAVVWILSFLKKRKELDYLKFELLSESQTSLIESINGVSDIKIFDSNIFRVNNWNNLQNDLYKINVKNLKISQLQLMGSMFFSQMKNLLISLIAAYAVVDNKLSVGGLMSISFIVAQMNSPIENLLDFILSSQEANISLERLMDSHKFETESKINDSHECHLNQSANRINGDIIFNDVNFSYTNSTQDFVLSNINMILEAGKLTAIVGASGSGKTTILKLLLNFYQPNFGSISIGSDDIATIDPNELRKNCGVVLQEGFIFSDSVIKNITMSDQSPNIDQLNLAITLSLVNEFVERLPLKLETKIGNSGISLSSGQKQRILVARAIYKNPRFLYFDEATSFLDSTNEKRLMNNILDYFKGKTKLVIAHRLSTVKEADIIYVLEKGYIVESGNHQVLIEKRGKYFELVKNQLELEN